MNNSNNMAKELSAEKVAENRGEKVVKRTTSLEGNNFNAIRDIASHVEELCIEVHAQKAATDAQADQIAVLEENMPTQIENWANAAKQQELLDRVAALEGKMPPLISDIEDILKQADAQRRSGALWPPGGPGGAGGWRPGRFFSSSSPLFNDRSCS